MWIYVVFGICLFTDFVHCDENSQGTSTSWIPWMAVASASLSLLGSGFIIISYFTLPYQGTQEEIRVVRTILSLSVCDFFCSLCWILDTADSECSVIGVAKLYFFSATALSTLLFAFSLHLLVARFNLTWKEKYDAILFALVWTLPLISVAVCIGLKADGPETFWCWLKEENLTARVILFDVPVVLILILDILIYFKVFRNLAAIKKESHSMTENQTANSTKTLRFVFRISLLLIVYFVCWIWIILDDFLMRPTESYVILGICAVITPLQGFLNAFIYGWTFHRKLVWWIRGKLGLSKSAFAHTASFSATVSKA